MLYYNKIQYNFTTNPFINRNIVKHLVNKVRKFRGNSYEFAIEMGFSGFICVSQEWIYSAIVNNIIGNRMDVVIYITKKRCIFKC